MDYTQIGMRVIRWRDNKIIQIINVGFIFYGLVFKIYVNVSEFRKSKKHLVIELQNHIQKANESDERKKFFILRENCKRIFHKPRKLCQ